MYNNIKQLYLDVLKYEYNKDIRKLQKEWNEILKSEKQNFGDDYIMNDAYKLYKRIMKHDPRAIDEIKNLEEAKEIIKMIVGNVYLRSNVYEMINEYK